MIPLPLNQSQWLGRCLQGSSHLLLPKQSQLRIPSLGERAVPTALWGSGDEEFAVRVGTCIPSRGWHVLLSSHVARLCWKSLPLLAPPWQRGPLSTPPASLKTATQQAGLCTYSRDCAGTSRCKVLYKSKAEQATGDVTSSQTMAKLHATDLVV